ncbi:MAG: hypothetical protein EXR21_10060 [Flavobacteriaceae bacterium]|nr:hypothetical protein [Flavobacteriaceae bacterium]
MNAQKPFVRTSIYYAPFALLHSAQGPSIRGGIEQSVSRKFSLFAEGSYFIRKSIDYNDLQGYRFETGVRYYLKPGWEDVENWDRWISLGIGKIEQTFTQPGKLFDPSFTPSKTITIVSDLNRKVQFIHFGFGVRIKLIARLYADANLQIGFRHRDIDVKGLNETDDDLFNPDTNDDWESASKQTSDLYIPDCAFNLRIGFDIVSRKK